MFFKKAPDGSVPAALPRDEAQRVEALRSYAILDTPDEALYDDLVTIASAICQTPIALLSLVDSHRQWIKARHGLPVTETSRDVAFCAHAILEPKPMVVDDALKDPRFATNPLVLGDPNIRFYAGVPLVNAEGHALGTLCAIDRAPRTLTAEQKEALAALGRQAMTQLELRRALIKMRAGLASSAASQAPAPRSAREVPRTETGDRARELLAQSDEMRNRIRDLLGKVEDIQKPPRK